MPTDELVNAVRTHDPQRSEETMKKQDLDIRQSEDSERMAVKQSLQFAVREVLLLSQMDDIVITPYSTFAYAAVVARRSSIPPLAVQYVNIPTKESYHECVRAASVEPPCHICSIERHEFLDRAPKAYLDTWHENRREEEAALCLALMDTAKQTAILGFLAPTNYPRREAVDNFVYQYGRFLGSHRFLLLWLVIAVLVAMTTSVLNRFFMLIVGRAIKIARSIMFSEKRIENKAD